MKVTYTTIPQVPHTKAILISRPVWLWGAEMGVNEDGVCMHFGGVVGDHSTSSMIVELKDDIEVWVTGTSTPCVSLFKPYRFGDVPTTPIYEENDPTAEAYWRNAELFRRTLLCHELPPEFYAERDALEADFLIHRDAKAAAEADRAFYERWSAEKLQKVPTSYQFRNRWAKKTKVLKDETK